jgi:hypothetical protein
MRWAGHIARILTKKERVYIVGWEREGKIPVRRQRHRSVDNIQMDLGVLTGLAWLKIGTCGEL